MCGLIQQCEQGQMHLAPEFAFLEILDDENRQVSAGEEGHMVWTSFVNRTMPMIRYRIGDRGSWQGGSCPCGRTFPLVVPTITRESDLLHCPDGRIFSPRALNQVLKEASSFRFCQFVQEAPNRVVVRAVPRNGDAANDLARIHGELARILGSGMQVTTVVASEPIVRAGGKIPLIVQKGKS
jgi:phenylacetate-CoA ligase